MQKAKKKIPLYKVRGFGDKFTATFDFIRYNFRLLMKGSIYLLLPLSLLQAFALNGLFGFMFELGLNASSASGLSDSVIVRTGVYYILYAILSMLGGVVISSLCYATLKYYNDNDCSLEGVNLRQLKPLIISAAKRSIAMGLVLFGALILVAGLIVLGATFAMPEQMWLFMGLLFVMLVLIIPLSLALPIYIFEDDTKLFPAVKRSLSMGFNHFGPILGFLIVMSMVSSLIQSTTMLPWYIMIIVKMFMLIDDPASTVATSPFYSFGVYLLAVIEALGMFISMVPVTLGQAFLYGSIVEKEENVSVEKDIEHFEEMSQEDKELDNFENL